MLFWAAGYRQRRYVASIKRNYENIHQRNIYSTLTFDEKGLKSIELVFNTNIQNYEKEFNYFKERLNNIYGDSNNINIWFEGRLELKLMPNYNIEINAYRIRSYPKDRKEY